jgi:hypothetical protein
MANERQMTMDQHQWLTPMAESVRAFELRNRTRGCACITTQSSTSCLAPSSRLQPWYGSFLHSVG